MPGTVYRAKGSEPSAHQYLHLPEFHPVPPVSPAAGRTGLPGYPLQEAVVRHRPLLPAVLVAVLVMAATVLAAGSAVPGSAAVGQAPRFPAVLTGAGGAPRSLLMINGSRDDHRDHPRRLPGSVMTGPVSESIPISRPGACR